MHSEQQSQPRYLNCAPISSDTKACGIPQALLCVLAIKQLKAAEDHQSTQYDDPKLRGEYKSADRTDPYDKEDQTEQLNLSRFSAAEYFSKSHTDHILKLSIQGYELNMTRANSTTRAIRAIYHTKTGTVCITITEPDRANATPINRRTSFFSLPLNSDHPLTLYVPRKGFVQKLFLICLKLW